MSGDAFGTYTAEESRSARRRVLVRGGLSLAVGPTVAVTTYVLAARIGLVRPGVDVLALGLLAALVTVVTAATLVVLAMAVDSPLVGLGTVVLVGWVSVTVALAGTAENAWLDAGVLAVCVVGGPLVAVLKVLAEAVAEWRRFERGLHES